MKGKKKTLVEKYNAALKKSNSSKKAYQNAVSYGKGVREDHTAAKDAKHTNDVIYLEYKKNWEAAKKAYDKGDSLSYQNYLDVYKRQTLWRITEKLQGILQKIYLVFKTSLATYKQMVLRNTMLN